MLQPPRGCAFLLPASTGSSAGTWGGCSGALQGQGAAEQQGKERDGLGVREELFPLRAGRPRHRVSREAVLPLAVSQEW